VRVSRSGIAAMGWAVASVLPLLASGCGGGGGIPGLGGSPASKARALMEQGRLDEALKQLEGAPSEPEVIFLQGQIWQKKAALAPAPTPAEGETEAPEFKLEERNALAFYETLTAAQPEHAAAHLAIADLLGPHAARHAEAQKARRRRGPEPTPDPSLPDFSAARIVREIEAAARADQSATPAEALIDFCTAAGDLDCAERGYRMLPERQPESAEPLHRLADFLLEQRQDPDAAIQQYDLALVWAPDDSPEDVAMRETVAGIYLDRAEQQLKDRHWALADQAIKSARKYLNGTTGPLVGRANQLEQSLAQQSGRRF